MADHSGHETSFADEFDTLSLDDGLTGTWQPSYWWSPDGYRDPATMSSWFVNPRWRPTSGAEANVYSVEDGVLSIWVKPTPASVASAVNGAPFLSGLLTTKRSFSQLYGYFEMRAKLPVASGLKSAFWLLPADGSWPPELDVEEVLGNAPTTLVTTAHTAVGGEHTADADWTTIPDASQAFHTYGVDWGPATITWYFDGVQVAQQATPADMHKPMYMLLDFAAGTPGSWGGAPNPGETARMQIDHVRVYDARPPAAASIPAGAAAPSTVAIGSGPDTLVLEMSQDAWQGDARFIVSVDGTRVGDVQTATASHAAGAEQTFVVSGEFGAGSHVVTIDFLNDAWGGTASADRNLYVDGASYNGRTVSGASMALFSGGPKSFEVSAPSSLTLMVSEDAWRGDARFTVSVDGVQTGGVNTVTALRSAGAVQTFTFEGAWSEGPHTVAVSFLNDAWGGTASADRNLYVSGAVFNGHASPVDLVLYTTGTRSFTVS